MAYRLTITFDSGDEEEQFFHEKSHAETAMEEWLSTYTQGEDYCDEAGESCPGDSIEDAEIDEIDDSEIEDFEYDD